ncbi:hypothetical protein JHK84_046188 [Glycine max]|uniref:Uncharacterized protein n=2 Tax=Glycine soja TaxID=3848 RepID=A0A445G099_GLYSO|nr:uncharacterized protein LOC114391821 [Glycine soja]KAG5101219.1 hypothetical protein JHK84_046188 [Glycine max]RZB54668.1 hypothetical protein D0Y65_044559 [Glycine soja]
MPSNKQSSMPSNPNPRSSEVGNPMRRSFTGNPFSKPSIVPNHGVKTPANSPSADFSRRGSVGIRESGGSLRDSFDDKENGKDQILKPTKVRSPAVSSKGSKNFMSPTISASCKINESPRKKVLIEKNEAVPSPADKKSHVRKVTFAEPLEEKMIDGIIPNFEEGLRSSLSSEDLSGESETSETHYMDVPLISKNDTDLCFESVNDVNVNVPLVLENDIYTEPSFETEPDCVNLDPTFKLSPTATPPISLKATVVAPLDADPLMPPYDPKTNYLSPRPQFLHYKPKSRMELCRERELDDSFISGSFSDTEVTEDSQSEVSQKESEDVSSDETVKEEEGEISELSPARRTLMPGESVEAKQVPKPRFTVRAKAVALILLLAVAFVSISVTDSPVIDRTVFEGFYKVYVSSEFPEFARANFDLFTQFAKTNFNEIARNLQIWFTKLLSSTSEFISDVRGGHNLAKLQYYNLTIQHDYSMVDQYPIFGHGENEIGETHVPVWDADESDAVSDIDGDEDIEGDISEEHYEIYEEQVQQDVATITGAENVLDAPESEEVQSEQLAEAGNLEATVAQEAEANLNVENQPSLNLEVAEISIEAYESDTKQAHENDAELNVNEQSDISLDSDVAAAKDDVAEEKSESIDAAIKGNEGRLGAIDIPPHVVLCLLLGAGTVLIAGAAFNWSRKKGSKSISSVEKPLELHNDSFPSKNKQISPEKSSGPVEMDVLEDSSCPSEASSIQQSSFYCEKEVNEGHRLGPEKKRKNNYRRESLASSASDYSMGSPSYGSLTLYEKIPIKQGHWEDEIITPVRRSSRIRNQATSPS